MRRKFEPHGKFLTSPDKFRVLRVNDGKVTLNSEPDIVLIAVLTDI